MIFLNLPTDAPDFTFRATLGDADFLISMQWNQRAQRWHMSLADADGAPIVHRVKMVPSWDLLRRLNDDRRPAGGLYVLDTLGRGEPPAYVGWGDRWFLGYND
jgi:hypothetical protein